jgi:hypothetical protein
MVDDTLGDLGIGRKLLQKAIAFVDDQAFAKAHLYTFRRLDGTYPVSKGIVSSSSRVIIPWDSWEKALLALHCLCEYFEYNADSQFRWVAARKL